MKRLAALTIAAATTVSLMAADGAAIYKTKCANCHGAQGEKHANGKSVPIKDMTKDEVYQALKEYKAGTRDAHGLGALMKAQVANMSDEELKAVSDYIGK